MRSQADDALNRREFLMIGTAAVAAGSAVLSDAASAQDDSNTSRVLGRQNPRYPTLADHPAVQRQYMKRRPS